MAVAVEMTFVGGTLDQYDQVISLMGFSPGGTGAPHGLFHWVAKTDDGIRVVDVWDSQEEFRRFSEEKIGPFVQQVGLSGPPEVTITPIHNYLTAG